MFIKLMYPNNRWKIIALKKGSSLNYRYVAKEEAIVTTELGGEDSIKEDKKFLIVADDYEGNAADCEFCMQFRHYKGCVFILNDEGKTIERI